MTLLPAIFAREAARIAPEAATGFGLWSFASKFSLAFAAVLFLPMLQRAGFDPGAGQITDASLTTLTLLYAILPLGLKLLALGLLTCTRITPGILAPSMKGAPT